jgi:hypothetical protein
MYLRYFASFRSTLPRPDQSDLYGLDLGKTEQTGRNRQGLCGISLLLQIITLDAKPSPRIGLFGEGGELDVQFVALLVELASLGLLDLDFDVVVGLGELCLGSSETSLVLAQVLLRVGDVGVADRASLDLVRVLVDVILRTALHVQEFAQTIPNGKCGMQKHARSSREWKPFESAAESASDSIRRLHLCAQPRPCRPRAV